MQIACTVKIWCPNHKSQKTNNTAEGVLNLPEGHQFVWNLEFVIWNFPEGVKKTMMNYE
jgi:hypothetical protein